MSAERERGASSWLVPLLGAAVLFLLGFGVGVVVGAARQEPALVLRHLSGDGERVELPTEATEGPESPPSPGAMPPVEARGAAPAEALPGADPAPRREDTAFAAVPPAPRPLVPPVAAKEPARGAAAAPAVPVPVAPAPRAEAGPGAKTPPAVAAAPPPGPAAASPSSRYSIQVGAFADSAQAKALARKLEKKGLPVVVSAGTGERDSRWRVRVGPLASRAEADKVAKRLHGQDKLPTWILDESR